MLESRVALVTTLGDAIDAHRRTTDNASAAKAAQETAAATARTAHADAIAGGWTAAELRDAGLLIPAGPRRKRTTTTIQAHDQSASIDE